MKIVEKPEGFELRDLRSARKHDAAEWIAHDAVYDASTVIPKNAKVAAVLWRDPDTGWAKARYAGTADEIVALLSRSLHARLG